MAQTALQELIENCKTAMEHSKDGYVTYEEVIEVAQSLLPKERQIIEDAYNEGYRGGEIDEYKLENDISQFDDAANYFTQNFNPIS